MIRKTFKQTLLSTVVAASVLPIAPTFAEGVLEEVIVNARKRAETMQDVPISITAFSGDALEKAGYKELQNLNEGVPNLEFSKGNVAQIHIRGIGQRDAGATVDPGVGIYFDGIYLARVDAQMLDTADVSSIQVLRGPQGTLFGKNNVGGAMLLQLVKPSDEMGGYIELGTGNLNYRSAKASIDIPLVDDKLLSRFTVASRKREGYMEHVDTSEKFSDLDRMSVLGQIRWLPSESTTVDLLLSASKQAENQYGFACSASNAEALIPANFTTIPNFEPGAITAACERSKALLEKDQLDADGIGIYQSKSQLVGLTVSHEMEIGTIKSVTSFTRQDVNVGVEDNDGTPLPVSGRIDPQDFGYDRHNGRVSKQYSQELQFSGLAFDDKMDYTFGVFAQGETIDERNVGSSGGSGLLALTPSASGQPFPILLPDNTSFPFSNIDIDKQNETYAAFAQFSYDVTDWLELTVGGRYTVEKREVDTDIARIDAATADALLTAGGAAGHFLYLPGVAALGFLSPTGISDFYNEFIAGKGYPLNDVQNFQGDEKYSQFTPMVSLSFSAPDDMAASMGLDGATVYVTYASGFKSGGLEAIARGLTRFNPEEVDNFEIGFKLDALDNRLRLNGAVFQTDYKEIQIRNAQQFGGGADVDVIISNAGKAEISGAELELTWQIVDSLQFSAAAGFLDAELTEFNEVNRDDLTTPLDRSDEDFQEVPKKTFNVALTHIAELDIGTITSRVDAYYRDEIYIGIDDFSWDRREDSTLDSYTVANARVAWESPSQDWQVAAWVQNLTDKRYFDGRVGVLGLIGSTQVNPMPPRTFGLDLKFSF